MRIVFMGTPRAAAVGLERLIADEHDVVAVYTQPDRPSGRGKNLGVSAVKEAALAHDVPVYQPTKIKTEEALKTFRGHDADVVIVVAYGRILPSGFLTAYEYGALNVHFSLLPKYRGAAPVNWAIVNGESQTGVTIIQMDEGLDTGDIIATRSIFIGQKENSVELMERLSFLGANALSDVLIKIDALTPTRQNDAEASFAPILRKDDGLIDWRMSAKGIERRVRGFQPFPTSYTFYGGNRLTIWNSEVVELTVSAREGSIIEASGGRLIVASGNSSALSITEIQPEGKRRMTTRDFLNGSKLRIGDILTLSSAEVGAANQ